VWCTWRVVGRFRDVSDYRKYIARLAAIPAQVAQVTELLREGVAQQMLPPEVV